MEQIPSGPMAGRTVLVTGGTGGIGRLGATASINVEDLSSFFSVIRLCSDSARTDILRKASVALRFPRGPGSSLPGHRDRRPISAYTVRLALRYPNKCLERLGRAPAPSIRAAAERRRVPTFWAVLPNYTPVIYLVRSRYGLARPVETPERRRRISEGMRPHHAEAREAPDATSLGRDD